MIIWRLMWHLPMPCCAHWVMLSLIRVSYFCKEERNYCVSHCHIDDVWSSYMTPTINLTSTPIRMYTKCNCKKKQERVLSFGLDSHRLQDKWIFMYVLEDKYSKGFISFVYTGEWTCWVISVFDIHICLALTISAIRGKIHVQQHLLISFLSTLDGSLYAVFN